MCIADHNNAIAFYIYVVEIIHMHRIYCMTKSQDKSMVKLLFTTKIGGLHFDDAQNHKHQHMVQNMTN